MGDIMKKLVTHGEVLDNLDHCLANEGVQGGTSTEREYKNFCG